MSTRFREQVKNLGFSGHVYIDHSIWRSVASAAAVTRPVYSATQRPLSDSTNTETGCSRVSLQMNDSIHLKPATRFRKRLDVNPLICNNLAYMLPGKLRTGVSPRWGGKCGVGKNMPGYISLGAGPLGAPRRGNAGAPRAHSFFATARTTGELACHLIADHTGSAPLRCRQIAASDVDCELLACGRSSSCGWCVAGAGVTGPW